MINISDGGYVIFAKKRDKMTQKTIKARILLRSDTATQLAFTNPVLYKNELAIEKDTGKKKLGDGSTSYNNLPYLEKTIWNEIKNVPTAFTPAEHTHNYAGSSSAGGAATSANKLNTSAGDAGTPIYFKDGVPVECTSLSLEVKGNADTATTAEKLSINAGSPTKPIYFTGGIPVNTTYELNATVPKDAKFTDTVYTHPYYAEKANDLYKITVTKEGHVSGVYPVTKEDITKLGIPAQDTVYVHPNTHEASMVTGLASIATSGQYSDLIGAPTSIAADGGNADTVGGHTVGTNVPANAVFTDKNVTSTLATTTKAYITGTTSETTNTGTQVFDTGVYLGNGAGELVAAKFTGSLNGVAAKATADANGNTITSTYATKAEVGGIKYAASASVGGAATSANKINTDAGSATQPIYFNNGIPVKTTYTLGTSVPANAKFTDTTYVTGTSETEGLTKLYSVTGTNTDGTMTQEAISNIFTGLNEADASTIEAVSALNDKLSNVITNAYTKEEINTLLGNSTVGELAFTDSEWNGDIASGYTLTKELGLAKVLGVYQGNSASGYKAVEADNINISAGGTLTLTSPNSFEGSIILSATMAFDSSVADRVDEVIDGKVDDSVTANIGDRVSSAVAGEMAEHNADTSAHEAALANYVDLTSSQTISGRKIFNGGINLAGANWISADSNITWYSGSPNTIRGILNFSNYSGTAARAEKLTTSAGSENTPVYFKDGVPVECTGIGLDSVMPINYDDTSTTTFGFEVINNELYLLSSLSEDSSAIATLNAQIPWSNILNSPFNIMYNAYSNGLWKFSTNEYGQVVGAEAVTKADIDILDIMGTTVEIKADNANKTSFIPFVSGSGEQELKYYTNLTFNPNSGALTATKVYNAVYADYAEFFPRGEETEAGDIIALDMNSEEEKYIKATADSIIAGVHSNEFAHIIGGEEAPEGKDFVEHNMSNFIPVSLAGRVHVKVSGTVKKGDYIIASDIPGIGVASNNPANQRSIVGYAVESSNNKDIKKVLVRVKGA